MFAVIYRFQLHPHQEKIYQQLWQTLAQYFIQERGSLGSCLHKGEDGVWVAYSRWPDKATRDAAWPGDDAPNTVLPEHIRQVILEIQSIKQANQDLPQFDEICLTVVNDFL